MNEGSRLILQSSEDRLRGELTQFLAREIEVGSFPGAVWAVGDVDGNIIQGALGNAVIKPARIATSIDTRYDIASLTKPLVTATLALISHQKGVVDLEAPISRWIPELKPDKRDLTLIDLLTHRAGFQAWYPLYANGYGAAKYLEALIQRPLRYEPGTREIYSCLGYVLTRLVLELAWGEVIEDVAHREMLRPLGISSACFTPSPREKYTIAATEWGNTNERRMVAERNIPFRDFRNYMIWGEVNDGNAWYMGGYGGNAGLFATAQDVIALAMLYLRSDSLLTAESRALASQNYTSGKEENRGIGWQLKMDRPNHPSNPLSSRCFGHTGFTGTSVWVDPERGLALALLTNRLHPTVQTLDMQRVRRRFHEIVVSDDPS